MDRIGFSLTELLVPIVTITISRAIYLYKRGLTSTDKIKALYNKIKTLLNKTKKSTKDCLTGMDINPKVYILETMQKL